MHLRQLWTTYIFPNKMKTTDTRVMPKPRFVI